MKACCTLMASNRNSGTDDKIVDFAIAEAQREVEMEKTSAVAAVAAAAAVAVAIRQPWQRKQVVLKACVAVEERPHLRRRRRGGAALV